MQNYQNKDHKIALLGLYPPVSYDVNGKNLTAQCEIDGSVFDTLQRSAIDMLNTVEPQTSGTLLTDWERLCGMKPDFDKPYSERVKRVILQLNTVGGLSIPYFTRLAQSIGYEIQIKEFSPLKNDLPDVGDIPIQNSPTERLIFMWRVTVTHGDSTTICFRAGQSVAGDRLVAFGDPIIEAFFKDLKPAHTYCYFAYKTS